MKNSVCLGYNQFFPVRNWYQGHLFLLDIFLCYYVHAIQAKTFIWLQRNPSPLPSSPSQAGLQLFLVLTNRLCNSCPGHCWQRRRESVL